MQLQDLKGMGAGRLRKLAEAGITSPLDLLLRFPYKYIDVYARVDPFALQDGATWTGRGIVSNVPKVQYIRKGLCLVKAVLQTEFGVVEASWFNQKFIVAAIPQGKTVCVHGKIKRFGRKMTLSAAVLLSPSEGTRILPLYRAISGVPRKVLDEALETILRKAEITGFIPESVRATHGLPPLAQAFRAIHRPTDIESAASALRSIAVEKLGYGLATFELLKEEGRRARKHIYTAPAKGLSEVIAALPFRLTDGQRQALSEILAAMRGESAMNRLLQGDVGCGKTVVALLAMYYAYTNGYQSVLMAPTEVLAWQHYKAAIRYLEPFGAHVALLCGSLSASEREDVLFRIRTQSADIVIGTHALLSDNVQFGDLSLVVTDEQQRFGVNQRSRLESKAAGADILVMTATPIPRTLALCMYGELEQSCITTLPEGRPNIATSIVPPHKFDKMYDYICRQAERGEQTYIVCPRIEQDEETDIMSVNAVYDTLCKRYPALAAGVLHGKMRDADKMSVMDKFRRGELTVLVATTVIEVGVDVPEATHIVIYNADRYGLSQLHQLRGRVGRGRLPGYCFLPVEGEADERLRFFCTCSDGFRLSEYDFDCRGAGDFIGTRQHGDTEDSIVKLDAALLQEAKEIAMQTLADASSRERLRTSLTSGAEEFVRSITMN